MGTRGSMLAPRVVRRLLQQHDALAAALVSEFSLLGPATAATPRFHASMEAYALDCSRAAKTNREALVRLFGPPEAASSIPFAWLRENGWLSSNSPPSEYDELGSVWRHLAKDWTDLYSGRAAPYRERVVAALIAEGAAVRSVLVPGVGAGRLAVTLADALPAARVEGFDASPAQLAVAEAVLGRGPELGGLPFHPFLDEPRNHASPASRLAKLSLHEVLPARPPNLSLRAASLEEHAGRGSYDAVVSCFFLDALGDVAGGLRALRAQLRPGGLLLLLGPLAYHPAHWPQLSPSLEQLLILADEVGLERLGSGSSAGGPEQVNLAAGVELLRAEYYPSPLPTLGGHGHEWTAFWSTFRAV